MLELRASTVHQVYTPATSRGWAWLLPSIGDSLLAIVRHRELVAAMALRDLKAFNKGALLGGAWLVIRPLVQTAAYVAIVSFVLRSAMAGTGGPWSYALYVLSGMIPWQLVTRSLEAAPSLIRERTELVKQVIYPLETLPIVELLVASCGSAVSLAVYLACGLAAGELSWTMLLLPLPVCLLCLFTMGVAWVLMIAGAVVKDLREVVSLVLGLSVYASPVVLREEAVSPRVWAVVLWNPISHIVICFRDVYRGEFHPASWLIFGAMSAAALIAGAAVMARARRYINEYI
jgi:lipopolysaccharide transport system permease protein